MLTHTREELLEVVKVLNERVWGGNLNGPLIDRWLDNFGAKKTDNRDLALHLLSNFMYFGQREIRVLLRALYRDLYRAPLLQSILEAQSSPWDLALAEHELGEELAATRFLGIGNPSESGTHLLYYFRQENGLPSSSFLNTHEIFRREPSTGRRLIRDPKVKSYVFVDDLCGSGSQAKDYSDDIVDELKRADPKARVSYFALFGLAKGLEAIRLSTAFDDVGAICLLDESFRCFEDNSRYFLPNEADARRASKTLMEGHGRKLWQSHPLGFRQSQLLLGFFHNVPDNTLPVIWCEENSWVPIFRRYHKKY